MAEAATRYWRARLDFNDALSSAQQGRYRKAVPIPPSIQTTAGHCSKRGVRQS
jgi:hypothetical protein